MTKTYRFQTIQQYQEHKGKLQSMAVHAFFFAAAVCALLLNVANLIHKKPHTQEPKYNPSSSGMLWSSSAAMVCYDPNRPIADQPGTGVSFKEASAALNEATAAWRTALGENIQKPILSPGYCEDEGAIACATINGNEIFFNARLRMRDGKRSDLKTVFMHEVGHLLGIHHIESDPLMDASYQGKLDRPSVVAVAVAKTIRAEKRAR